jgi:phospho-N-acetylmuramoyl-pentapeptide-transferase
LNAWLPEGPYAARNELFRASLAILFSFFFVAMVGRRVIAVLVALKTGRHVDYGHEWLNNLAKDKANVPTMGGVMMLAAILFAVLMLGNWMNFYVRLGVFCIIWLGVVGGFDDWLKLTVGRRLGTRQGLKSYEKLLFQFGLGVLLAVFIYREGERNNAVLAVQATPNTPQQSQVPAFRILAVPFYKQGILLSVPAFMIITVLVTAFTSNAVNLTDGMDGLASGCAAMCGFAFMILTYLIGDAELARSLLLPHIPQAGELAVLCGAMVGACLGFLWFNCPPASVFMGDTGSLPLGGLIGFVAVVIRQELMLILVGGVFVIEALSVMLQVGYFKWTGGRRLFRMAPIHHHYHMKGWTETQVVLRFWTMAAVFTVFALLTVKLR